MSKNKKVAGLGLLLSMLTIMSGPVTLIILSSKLSPEYLGFYFTFFSIIAIQQLLEAGLGNVLRQYYAHENSLDINGLKNISSYFRFSIVWYVIISIFFVFLSAIVGEWMFSTYNGEIEWRIPFYSLLISSAFIINQLPIKSFLDGTQRQETLQIINIVQKLFSVVTLWLSLYLEFGLASIAISQLFSSLIFFMMCKIKGVNFKNLSSPDSYSFKIVFKKLYPLLKKTGIVWILGYFYWNGFNVISFKVLGPEITGMIGLTVSMARAGMSIAQSLALPQMTIFSKYISQREIYKANSEFLKFSLVGFIILLSGYSLFIFIIVYFDLDFSLFNKCLDPINTIYVFIFFILAFIISQLDNFTRCFKVELFVKIQALNSILTPVLFLLSILFNLNYFFLPSIGLLLVLYLTYNKYKYCLKYL